MFLGPQDSGSEILEDIISYNSFPRVILGISYPFTATLSWNLRNHGSHTGKVLLDPVDPGFGLASCQRTLQFFGRCTKIIPVRRLLGDKRAGGDRCALGMLKKHQLWKFKAGRMVSHGCRHAEFNGAKENRFQAL